eukprot:3111064-Ditylum_brightwellii.AAC.1
MMGTTTTLAEDVDTARIEIMEEEANKEGNYTIAGLVELTHGIMDKIAKIQRIITRQNQRIAT